LGVTFRASRPKPLKVFLDEGGKSFETGSVRPKENVFTGFCLRPRFEIESKHLKRGDLGPREIGLLAPGTPIDESATLDWDLPVAKSMRRNTNEGDHREELQPQHAGAM